MRKLVLVTAASLALIVGAVSLPGNDPASRAAAEEAERSGCCSWHSGVCGCSGGRVVCCDGVLSPSCTC